MNSFYRQSKRFEIAIAFAVGGLIAVSSIAGIYGFAMFLRGITCT
jgi:hypothetical protein